MDLFSSSGIAGGVGGVLAINAGSNGVNFTAYDADGNLVGLAQASTGTQVASYQYEPFGHILRASGSAAKANPIRFSTQFNDDITGNAKFLYRDETASLGRWASLDPIGEAGGLNLVSFLANDPLGAVDPYGTVCAASCTCKTATISPADKISPLFGPPPPGSPRGPTQALDVGFRIDYNVTWDGDPTLCKCKYKDAGSVKYSYSISIPGYPTSTGSGSRNFDKPSDTHDFPCDKPSTQVDWPGVNVLLGPAAGSIKYSLTYNMTLTVTCVGSDGSKAEDSRSLSGGPYSGEFSWPKQKLK